MNDVGADSDLRPTDPVTGEALPPREQPGYYPGYRSLRQQRFWDATTRALVIKRVESPPPMRYFNADQECFWSIVFEHLIPQSDRTEARRIPIVNVVDRRLWIDRSIGYRFADMPPDREAYALAMEAIDGEARVAYDAAFVDLDFTGQERILKRIHDGDPQAAPEIWQRMSVHRLWQLVINDAVDAYYAHPWAWDEIGFGGPAYPRAYTRLERGEPEPWEVREQRYDWAAPRDAISDETEHAHEFCTEAEQHCSHVKKTAIG